MKPSNIHEKQKSADSKLMKLMEDPLKFQTLVGRILLVIMILSALLVMFLTHKPKRQSNIVVEEISNEQLLKETSYTKNVKIDVNNNVTTTYEKEEKSADQFNLPPKGKKIVHQRIIISNPDVWNGKLPQ